MRKKSRISVYKIVQNKHHHLKVLLNSFHLNGHTLGFHPQTYKVTTTFIVDSRFDSGSERVKKFDAHKNKSLNLRHVFVLDEWQAVGCYLNNGPLALPEAIDDNIKSVKGNDALFEHCKAKAEAKGYQLFGVDDKACWSGDKAGDTYDDYGKSSKCLVTKKTGNGSGKDINGDVFVYQLS